jgi:hypothetical protein
LTLAIDIKRITRTNPLLIGILLLAIAVIGVIQFGRSPAESV